MRARLKKGEVLDPKGVHRPGLVAEASVNDIEIGGMNPRDDYSGQDELVDSIKADGVIEPLIVRKGRRKSYELVAGERRLRAAKAAKLERVPVVFREDLDDAKAREIQLIENLMRKDLNPMEEAVGFSHYMFETKCTQQELAKKIHKAQGYISGRLSLMRLPDGMKKLIETGKMSVSHLRPLEQIKDSDRLMNHVENQILGGEWGEELSMRTMENIFEHVIRHCTKDVTQRRDPEDYYPRGAPFDVKPCRKCKKCIKIKTWNTEYRCIDSACYNEKKEAGVEEENRQKAERLEKKAEKLGVSEVLPASRTLKKDYREFGDYHGLKPDKRCKGGCDDLIYQENRYGSKPTAVCRNAECFDRKRKEKEEKEGAELRAEKERRVELVKGAEKAGMFCDDEVCRVTLAAILGNFGPWFARENEELKALGLRDIVVKSKGHSATLLKKVRSLDTTEIQGKILGAALASFKEQGAFFAAAKRLKLSQCDNANKETKRKD